MFAAAVEVPIQSGSSEAVMPEVSTSDRDGSRSCALLTRPSGAACDGAVGLNVLASDVIVGGTA